MDFTSPETVWRDIEGVNPEPSNSGDLPDLPLTAEPIYTPAVGNGPWGVPYADGQENPFAAAQLAPSADPQIDVPDVGWSPLPGAYEGAYRTHGPVQQFGHEVTGGWSGDQAIGRIMRFPANIPERYDANGVNVGDYRDLLAGALQANKTPSFTDSITNVMDLVNWSPPSFGGWDG